MCNCTSRFALRTPRNDVEVSGNIIPFTSPIRRVEFDRFGNLALPAVTIGEKFRLVIIKLLAGLGREFEIRALDDGIDRTGLLAQPAIDAFHHVDLVAHGAAGGVTSGGGAPGSGRPR